MPLFNVRVYGILVDEQKRVLVSDEFIRGNYITKFPGGGLEFGEGPIDCLKREFMEEMGQTITILGHFHTTDIFVQSKFNPKKQVLAIYYLISGIIGTLQPKNPKEQHLSLISIHPNNKPFFSFETDQKVCDLIVEQKFK